MDEVLVPIDSTQNRLGGIGRSTVYKLVKRGQVDQGQHWPARLHHSRLDTCLRRKSHREGERVDDQPKRERPRW